MTVRVGVAAGRLLFTWTLSGELLATVDHGRDNGDRALLERCRSRRDVGSRAERQQDKSQHSGRAGRERRSDEIEGAGANKCSQGREIYGASPSPANELPLSEMR